MKTVSYFVTLLWILMGLYFGIAGWQGSKALEKTSVEKSAVGSKQSYEFEGLNFADENSLREFLRERSSNRWFPWIFSIPQDTTPLIAAMAFGLLGGAARLLKQLSLDSEEVAVIKLFSDPLFGSIIGLMVFFLSLLLPALLTSGRNPVRPEAIVGFSLFGGVFSEHAYEWIQKQVVKSLFSDNRRTQKRR
jgi:hypothetical protein